MPVETIKAITDCYLPVYYGDSLTSQTTFFFFQQEKKKKMGLACETTMETHNILLLFLLSEMLKIALGSEEKYS